MEHDDDLLVIFKCIYCGDTDFCSKKWFENRRSSEQLICVNCMLERRDKTLREIGNGKEKKDAGKRKEEGADL